MWTDDWIDFPHEMLGRGPDSYDCLGLFLALQRARKGRELFDPLCTTREAIEQEIVAREKHLWHRVERGEEGDAVLIMIGGAPLHIGYALDERRMLHVLKGMDTAIEDYIGTKWGDRVEGVYRYAG